MRGVMSERPRALLVTSSFLPGHGGIETYLDRLGRRLLAAGAPVAVIAPARRGSRPIPNDLPYRTIGYPGTFLWPGQRAARAIIAAAVELGVERVVFGTPWPLVLVAPMLARRRLRYSVVVHGAELLVPAAVPWLRRRLGRALAGADLLLPVSGYTASKTKEFLERSGMDAPPMTVLRAEVDTERFHPSIDTSRVAHTLAIPPEAKVVLCFGRLVRRKGIHRLIEAFTDIESSVPNVVLVIAGTGPEEKRLGKLAARRASHVVFAGRVADDDAPALYARADVFVLPVVDRWFGLEVEGLGVVLVEAAACGTPAVTGRSGGTPEAVLDGHTGFVVDARDRRALREKVVTLLGDAELARSMGVAARSHVERSFGGAPPDELLVWLSGRDADRFTAPRDRLHRLHR